MTNVMAWSYNSKKWSNYAPFTTIYEHIRIYNSGLVITGEWYGNHVGYRLWTFFAGGGLTTTDNSNSTFVNWVKANGTLINTGA